MELHGSPEDADGSALLHWTSCDRNIPLRSRISADGSSEDRSGALLQSETAEPEILPPTLQTGPKMVQKSAFSYPVIDDSSGSDLKNKEKNSTLLSGVADWLNGESAHFGLTCSAA
jgi:hypothetical protein